MGDYVIALSGEAGQGLNTIGDMLALSLFRNGYCIFTDKSYHSRIRGGEYVYRIRISDSPLYSMRQEFDLIVSLSKSTTISQLQYFHDGTTLIYDSDSDHVNSKDFDFEVKAMGFPFKSIAKEAGEPRAQNVVALGGILGLFNVKREIPSMMIEQTFSGKEEIIKANLEALKRGYDLSLPIETPRLDAQEHNYYLMNGTEGTGLGAIAAGCKFLAAYPMTPGTGVMTFLASNSEKHGIVVEQAEDEIAAVNMVIGGAFAGVRSLVTTSGGGFALMQEGVSLAAMTETPLVMVDGQRPAPATGLPTRTAQEDLLFVVNAGHGEFPKYVVSPRTPKEAFELTEKAFYIADKYQIPSIILLTESLVDSSATIEAPIHKEEFLQRFITEGNEEYRRYEITENGVSPRAIPGGKATARVDSDEHDEAGYITEDLEIRRKMVDKRMKKMEGLLGELSAPAKFNLDAPLILVGWGDSWGAIDEFAMSRKDIGYVHYSEVFPIDPSIKEELAGKNLCSIEGNFTGQFATLLRSVTGLQIEHVGRYDGRPISANWIERSLKKEGMI
ncbi:2-oxoacid:acceptor oxidoreductase subunit alpha [Mesotoga sp. H07.pep.5.3]|uniref:2-oxoacid:acceptor oxidoreductase subunit alpha n=1 Tax=Mesotoga sp. H07.pep.5.3 TaxID=1421003 RepID=UPI000C19A796|nr:2-oxoacid:acceptor oxidoreductase subunit alpha [Mesotoga sp. H07.pep.5.3]PIJ62550.1 pyruvate ferredoxin oxidoreductase [Mesotoga sp. H07.pep.5.3]